jgi:hypothetical protein
MLNHHALAVPKVLLDLAGIFGLAPAKRSSGCDLIIAVGWL